MEKRPELSQNLDSQTFRQYYYLKEELVEFCRQNHIPTSGGKIEITERIAYFLETGKILKNSMQTRKHTSHIEVIHETDCIESHFVCSEKHRAFFKEMIGPTFSFNVIFQKWLKNNAGKTYRDAIEAYYQIIEDKKKGKTKIDKQFEYNTYIRDFFAHNKGRTLDEAIQCWKYKKSLPGHNHYEESDLDILSGLSR